LQWALGTGFYIVLTRATVIVELGNLPIRLPSYRIVKKISRHNIFTNFTINSIREKKNL